MRFSSIYSRITLLGLLVTTLCSHSPAMATLARQTTVDGPSASRPEIGIRQIRSFTSIYGRSLSDMIEELAKLVGVKIDNVAFDWQRIWRQAEETRLRTDASTRARVEELQREIMEEAKRLGTQIGSMTPTSSGAAAGAMTTASTPPPASVGVDPALQADRDDFVGALDDPSTHDPDDYNYLVHIFSGAPADVAEFLGKDGATSASLITSGSSSVVPHGTTGFILSPGQIEVTSPVDLGLDNDAMRELSEEMRRQYYENLRNGEGLMSPQQLAGQTPPGQHNEVVISSTPDKPTTVVGVFVLEYTLPDGTTQVLVSAGDLAALQAYADEHDIPLIRIPYTDPEAY